MNRAQRDKLRQLKALATPGPYVRTGTASVRPVSEGAGFKVCTTLNNPLGKDHSKRAYEERWAADADFIVAACNAIDELCDDADRNDAEWEELIPPTPPGKPGPSVALDLRSDVERVQDELNTLVERRSADALLIATNRATLAEARVETLTSSFDKISDALGLKCERPYDHPHTKCVLDEIELLQRRPVSRERP